jgi:hypothetical protein
MSIPEGYPGHCDLTIVDNNNNTLYAVCTYEPPCVPLGVRPCQDPNDTCLVTSPSGTSQCAEIFNPDGGAGALVGQPCAAGNACANNLDCLSTAADGGDFTCLQLCYVQGTTPPFDAGLVNMGAPGMGGCPANQNCGSVPNLFPAWLGLCQ